MITKHTHTHSIAYSFLFLSLLVASKHNFLLLSSCVDFLWTAFHQFVWCYCECKLAGTCFPPWNPESTEPSDFCFLRVHMLTHPGSKILACLGLRILSPWSKYTVYSLILLVLEAQLQWHLGPTALATRSVCASVLVSSGVPFIAGCSKPAPPDTSLLSLRVFLWLLVNISVACHQACMCLSLLAYNWLPLHLSLKCQEESMWDTQF